MEFHIDISNVVDQMVQASSIILSPGGRHATAFAAHEYAQFIRDVEHIHTMVEQGTMTVETAQTLVEQHKLSMQAALLTVEGLGVIETQQAINAAVKVLNTVLATVVGTAAQGLKFAL
jgi:hypothetical protein